MSTHTVTTVFTNKLDVYPQQSVARSDGSAEELVVRPERVGKTGATDSLFHSPAAEDVFSVRLLASQANGWNGNKRKRTTDEHRR